MYWTGTHQRQSILLGEMNGSGRLHSSRNTSRRVKVAALRRSAGRGERPQDHTRLSTRARSPSQLEQKPVQNSNNVNVTQDTALNLKKKKSARGIWKGLAQARGLGSRPPRLDHRMLLETGGRCLHTSANWASQALNPY